MLKQRELAVLRAEFGDAAELRDEFARVAAYFAHLEALGVAEWVVFDLSIVRGLAYYTGTVFELFDARGEFRAIAGGGRYDNLLAAVGGVDMPALGFGMGDVVLGELLRDRGLMPSAEATLDFWVASESEGVTDSVMRVATELRQRGQRVEYALRKQSLDKQRKAARSAGATRLVVIPEDFHATREVFVRFVDPALAQATGGGPLGTRVSLDDLLSELAGSAAGRGAGARDRAVTHSSNG